MMDLVFWDFFYGDFERFGRRAFQEHEARVRALAPADRFLEFRVDEGWGPLCGFLGKEVPEGPFPRSNDTLSWREMFGVGVTWGKAKRLGTVVGVAVPVVLAVGVYLRKGR